MTVAEAVQKYLPPLATHKRPGLAAIIGVLFGGVGLAIYFRSLRDLLPLEVVSTLVIVGSAIAGVPPLDVLSVLAMPAAIFGAATAIGAPTAPTYDARRRASPALSPDRRAERWPLSRSATSTSTSAAMSPSTISASMSRRGA